MKVEKATYWPKIAIILYPLAFELPVNRMGVPSEFRHNILYTKLEW